MHALSGVNVCFTKVFIHACHAFKLSKMHLVSWRHFANEIHEMKLEIANDVKYQTCLGGRNLAEQMSKLIPNDNPCVSQLPGNGPVRIECGMVTRTGR